MADSERPALEAHSVGTVLIACKREAESREQRRTWWEGRRTAVETGAACRRPDASHAGSRTTRSREAPRRTGEATLRTGQTAVVGRAGGAAGKGLEVGLGAEQSWKDAEPQQLGGMPATPPSSTALPAVDVCAMYVNVCIYIYISHSLSFHKYAWVPLRAVPVVGDCCTTLPWNHERSTADAPVAALFRPERKQTNLPPPPLSPPKPPKNRTFPWPLPHAHAA